jgi:hypothetical protein
MSRSVGHKPRQASLLRLANLLSSFDFALSSPRSSVVTVDLETASRSSCTSLPSPPRVLTGGGGGLQCLHVAWGIDEVEAQLLWVHLAEDDSCVTDKSFDSCGFFFLCSLFLSCLFLMAALEAELEMLCHRLGQLLDYIGGTWSLFDRAPG